LEFDWDNFKNASNKVKHGFDFAYAATIFKGKTITQIDDRKDYKEQRFNVIGSTDKDLITLTYTMRDEVYRIISARKASRKERREWQLLK
jgi:uncharacterized protein